MAALVHISSPNTSILVSKFTLGSSIKDVRTEGEGGYDTMWTKGDKEGELIFTVIYRTSFMDDPLFPHLFLHNLLFCHGLILRILHHMVFGVFGAVELHLSAAD